MASIPRRLSFILGGTPFHVDGALQTGSSTVQVSFTSAPTATSSSGLYDALNPLNYSLSGPILSAVQSVAVIATDTVELTLYYPLTPGFWEVTVSNVKSVGGSTISPPKSWTFYVASAAFPDSPSLGTVNDTAYDVLRKFFNPALKGRHWESLLTALSVGEQLNYDNARLALDQIHICSSSEKYLVQRASDQGVVKPTAIGLSDALFRKYAITLKNERLTEKALLDISEVFYGTDAIKAHLVAKAAEPYAIEDEDDLWLRIDGKNEVRIVFDSSRFGVPGAAKALELAVQCNEFFDQIGIKAYAIGFQNPLDDQIYLKLYSYGIGLSSSIEVLKGTAQNQLHFDTLLNIYSGGLPTWNVTFDAARNSTTFSVTGSSNPDLSKVRSGDYVNVSGSEFNSQNRGSFEILSVRYEYSVADPPVLTMSFEMDGGGTVESVVQLAESSIQFFRPTKADCYTSNLRSVVIAGVGDQVSISLPATSVAVSRSELSGSYLHTPTSYDINYIQSGKQIVIDKGALSPGSTLIFDRATSTNSAPTIHSGGAGKTDYSYLSTWTSGTLTDAGGRIGHALLNVGGAAYTYGGEQVSLTIPPTYQASGQKTAYTIGTITTAGVTYPQVTFTDSSITQLETVSWGAGYAGASGLQLYGFPTSTFLYFGGILGATGVATNHVAYLSGSSTLAYAHNLNFARAFHAITAYTSSVRNFITGGMTDWQKATSTTEFFEPAAGGSFTNRASMATARAQHAQTQVSTTKYLVSGGRPMAQGPFVDSGTVALWRLDDSAATPADSGTGSYTLTGTSASLVSNYNANSKAAVSFDGLASKLTRAATAAIRTALTSNAYTASGWFKRTSNAQRPIFAYTGPSTPAVAADNILLGFGIDPSSVDNLIIYYDDATTARVSLTVNITALGGLLTGWNHWAITCQAGSTSGSKFILYINGRAIQTWDNQASPSGGANATLSIGYEPNAGYVNQYYQGYQSQIKLANVTYSAFQIWREYLSGTGEAYWFKQPTEAMGKERMGLATNSCEVYNSGSNTWTPTGSMTYARWGHRLVELPTGEFIAVGGYGYKPDKLGLGITCDRIVDCEIWNPTTGRWRPAGKLQYGGFVSANILGDKLFVYGSLVANPDVLDLKTMRWGIGIDPSGFGTGGAGVALSDDVVFYTGGFVPANASAAPAVDKLFYVQNEDSYYGGKLSGAYTIVSSDSDSSILEGPVGYGSGTATITMASAIAEDHPAGPFIFDRNVGVAPTAVSTTLTSKLAKGHSYPSVQVSDAKAFSETGYIVIGFGHSFATQPIQVLYKISDTELAIDASYVFPEDIEIGSTVIQSYGRNPDYPTTEIGQFYATDSPSGRVAAQSALEESVAAGTELSITIQYPGDRGLGAAGYPAQSNYKLSDIVTAFASSDDIDQAIQNERDK